MMERLIITIRDVIGYMKKKNISSFAASTAFFLFLSLIPMLMLFCSLIPYTPLSEAGLMSVVTKIMPDSMDALMIRVISDVYNKSIGVISVTAVITLWSAGKGILALMRGLNAVYNVEEERNYLVLRIIASFYTMLILILMLFSLVFLVFGNFLAEILENRIPQTVYLFEVLFRCRALFIWLFVTVVIALIYAYVPARKLHFR
ncbi:MAG: YihY/virulence factor BrkB family protein, partial [Lachnospiraceae bacterium]|nr:YihY/virulence factor BrkB family protein [Lachnospiraceae bacterium]